MSSQVGVAPPPPLPPLPASQLRSAPAPAPAPPGSLRSEPPPLPPVPPTPSHSRSPDPEEPGAAPTQAPGGKPSLPPLPLPVPAPSVVSAPTFSVVSPTTVGSREASAIDGTATAASATSPSSSLAPGESKVTDLRSPSVTRFHTRQLRVGPGHAAIDATEIKSPVPSESAQSDRPSATGLTVTASPNTTRHNTTATAATTSSSGLTLAPPASITSTPRDHHAISVMLSPATKPLRVRDGPTGTRFGDTKSPISALRAARKKPLPPIPANSLWRENTRIADVFFLPPFRADSESERTALQAMIAGCTFQRLGDLLTFTDGDSRRLAFNPQFSLRFVSRLVAIRNDFWRRKLRADNIPPPPPPPMLPPTNAPLRPRSFTAAGLGSGPPGAHGESSTAAAMDTKTMEAVPESPPPPPPPHVHEASEAAGQAHADADGDMPDRARRNSVDSQADADELDADVDADAEEPVEKEATYFQSFPHHYHPHANAKYFIPHDFRPANTAPIDTKTTPQRVPPLPTTSHAAHVAQSEVKTVGGSSHATSGPRVTPSVDAPSISVSVSASATSATLPPTRVAMAGPAPPAHPLASSGLEQPHRRNPSLSSSNAGPQQQQPHHHGAQPSLSSLAEGKSSGEFAAAVSPPAGVDSGSAAETITSQSGAAVSASDVSAASNTIGGAPQQSQAAQSEAMMHHTAVSSSARELVLTIAVPAYNEDADDLKRTLRSLYEQQPDLDLLGLRVHILVLMDGWFKMHASTKAYLQRMFPGDWPNTIKPIVAGKESECIETFVLQRVAVRPYDAGGANGAKAAASSLVSPFSHVNGVDSKHNPQSAVGAGAGAGAAQPSQSQQKQHAISLCPVDVHGGERLFVSVLIKRDNRRKHNSHAWFLSAFAPEYHSDFIFLTDCGTIFSRHALFHMFKELWLNPNWTAATGRPRVMTAAQQGIDREGVLESMCRAAQRFDFESSASSFTAAFSLVGMLPVLPGPCGLYRFAAVKDEAIPFYLESLNQNPDTAGMLMGSLLLAEDRVLSYAAVLKARNSDGAITAFIPEATFFFEAETDTEKLWTQRRRWINGTVAGYIWLILNAGMIFRSHISFVQKVFTTTLICSQLLMYVVVVLAPSFLALGLNLSLRGDQGGVLDEYRFTIMTLYLGLYVYFVVVHARLGNGEKKVVIWLVHVVTVINAVLSAWLMVWLIKTNLTTVEFSYPTLIVLTYLATPFVLALMQSPKSFGLMVLSFVPFVLYLPTMTGFWGAYAFSRLHDLTWGSRPSDTMLSAAAIAAAASGAGDNAHAGQKPGGAASAAAEAAAEHAKSVDQFKASLELRAHVICGVIVGCNLLSVVTVLSGLQNEQWGLYALSGFMFGFAFFQMIFSFLFFVVHRCRRLREGTRLCSHVCCRCQSRAAFYRAMRGLPEPIACADCADDADDEVGAPDATAAPAAPPTA